MRTLKFKTLLFDDSKDSMTFLVNLLNSYSFLIDTDTKITFNLVDDHDHIFYPWNVETNFVSLAIWTPVIDINVPDFSLRNLSSLELVINDEYCGMDCFKSFGCQFPNLRSLSVLLQNFMPEVNEMCTMPTVEKFSLIVDGLKQSADESEPASKFHSVVELCRNFWIWKLWS